MLWILRNLWIYRTEIAVAIALLAKIRRSAQEIARDYIRNKIETKLKHSIAVVLGQIALFIGAYFLTKDYPGPVSDCLASVALWGVTLFNLTELVLVTLPELHALHRTLKGKTGYAMKYFLEVSLVTELMRLNVLFLALCFIAGISSRTIVGSRFSYTRPWKRILSTEVARHKKIAPKFH